MRSAPDLPAQLGLLGAITATQGRLNGRSRPFVQPSAKVHGGVIVEKSDFRSLSRGRAFRRFLLDEVGGCRRLIPRGLVEAPVDSHCLTANAHSDCHLASFLPARRVLGRQGNGGSDNKAGDAETPRPRPSRHGPDERPPAAGFARRTGSSHVRSSAVALGIR
jgi:hypothetical protein